MRKPKRLLILALLVGLPIGGWLFWRYAHWDVDPNDIRAVTLRAYSYDTKAGRPVECQVRTTDKAIIRDLVDAWNGRARTFRPMMASHYGFVSMECRDGSKFEFGVRAIGQLLEGPEGVFFETSDRGRQDLHRIIDGYIESAAESRDTEFRGESRGKQEREPFSEDVYVRSSCYQQSHHPSNCLRCHY